MCRHAKRHMERAYYELDGYRLAKRRFARLGTEILPCFWDIGNASPGLCQSTTAAVGPRDAQQAERLRAGRKNSQFTMLTVAATAARRRRRHSSQTAWRQRLARRGGPRLGGWSVQFWAYREMANRSITSS